MTSELGLFGGFGVEIEYMIVDRRTLNVAPVADRLIEAVAGEPTAEVERGDVAWSNELVLHVLELKTNGPSDSLKGLSGVFHQNVVDANEALAPLGAVLLPGGAHPWMDPDTETRLWPHEHNEVYRTFDRIFACRGHGWANLQATHLNLPFQGDREFRALHTAIRAVLPMLPALAASSPLLDGRVQDARDQRLVEYRRNARKIPSVTGKVIPDAFETRADYGEFVLEPIYRDLAPHDPEGILRHEWVNARGAIARFDRSAIEIRTLDVQECPAADLAIVRAVARVVEEVCSRILDGDRGPQQLVTDELAAILDGVVREADGARVESAEYLEALGLRRSGKRWARDVWWELLDRLPLAPWEGSQPELDSEGRDPILTVLEEGTLASRIVRRVKEARGGGGADALHRDELREIYGQLAQCLAENRVFRLPVTRAR